VGQPGPPVAGPSPEPGAAWCGNCRASITPTARGTCPICGRFLPENTVALIHGLRSDRLAKKIDKYRVDLIEQLFAERGGKAALDVVSRIAIENYALVCAQHKTIEARLDQDGLFTQTGRRRSAFDMLKAITETIDRLRAQLPPIPARRPDAEPSVTVVRRVLVGPTINDPGPAPAEPTTTIADGNVPGTVKVMPTAGSAESAASDRCRFCGGPAADCTMLREHDSWWMGMHQQHPEVVALREWQRRERISRGHETAGSDAGILRT
jgi:hypothetical protein